MCVTTSFSLMSNWKVKEWASPMTGIPPIGVSISVVISKKHGVTDLAEHIHSARVQERAGVRFWEYNAQFMKRIVEFEGPSGSRTIRKRKEEKPPPRYVLYPGKAVGVLTGIGGSQ